MSIIQHPVHSCQKIKKKKSNISKNNSLFNDISIDNYNNNRDSDNYLIGKFHPKLNENENESLLNIFKKEKEIKDKLTKILINNPSVSQNDFFLNDDYIKNKFYNYNSNSHFLSLAKEILVNKLTPGEKNYLNELEQEINKVKKQISDAIAEKNRYNILLDEKKKEFQNFESNIHKIEFQFERDLINDLRSIINQFKIEIYRKELELSKKNDDDDNNEEIEKLKKEHEEVKNKLDIIRRIVFTWVVNYFFCIK